LERRWFNTIAWFFGILAMLIDLGDEIAADAMDSKLDLSGALVMMLFFIFIRMVSQSS
jgi:hypothetical protein